MTSSLPPGTVLRDLAEHIDPRGAFIEVFRDSWGLGPHPVQWNLIHSVRGSLRGVHVHPRHTDVLVVTSGTMLLGLHDIRRDSPAFGRGMVLELSGERQQIAEIPPGVAHVFYYPEDATLLNGVSHFWSGDDEVACRWDCRELGFGWSVADPLLSAKDAAAGSYEAMVEDFTARRQIVLAEGSH